jgi:amino acid transporter
VVTTILIGMVAMLFTAISYGRMANAYPSAGSAYTYVSREIHPAFGYVVGWGMLFDYVMNPVICVIMVSKASLNLIPEHLFPTRTRHSALWQAKPVANGSFRQLTLL